MPVVRTDLRDTRQRAKEIAYYPASAALTARNVQDAIDQVQAAVSTGSSKPPAIVPKKITVADSPYAVQSTDYLLLVDTSGGPVTINMQAAALRANLEVEIKDLGNASVNAISVVRSGAETIDGLATYPINTDFAAYHFKPVTGGYWVI